MTTFNQVLLKNYLMKWEVWLYLAFALYPLLVFIGQLFQVNFMQLDNLANVTLLEAYSKLLVGANQMLAPVIIISYVIATIFYIEINNGLLFLFKDINRKKVFTGKVTALLGVYGVYMMILAMATIITYYFYIVSTIGASGALIPTGASAWSYLIIELIAAIAIDIIIILVAINLSLYFSPGITIMGAVFFSLLAELAAKLDTLRYIFPNSYKTLFYSGQITFATAISIVIGLFALYAIILYMNAKSRFVKIEY